MSALYNVQREGDYSYVMRSYVGGGEWVEVARKDVPPPLAIIEAPDITTALSEARRRYGHNVIVSRAGAPPPLTQYRGLGVRSEASP